MNLTPENSRNWKCCDVNNVYLRQMFLRKILKCKKHWECQQRMINFCISLKLNSIGSIFVLFTLKSIILVYTRWNFKHYTRSRTDFSILKKLWHSQSYKSVRFTRGSKNLSKVPDLKKTKNSFEINGGFQVKLCKLIEVWAL